MAKNGAAPAEAHVVDEYDLQPGEVTKEAFAKQANVTSFRSVENWIRDEKIAVKKVRRRDANGRVRTMPIFLQDDIDQFLAEKDAETLRPAGNPMALERAGQQGDFQMQAMAFIADKLTGGNGGRKPFIPIAQAAAEYELSVPGIHQLIDDGLIKRFPGKNGTHMISRRQIESL